MPSPYDVLFEPVQIGFVPIRCTQNPTMGEEWRRGWHPEIIVPKKSEAVMLVTDRISNDSLYYELQPALADGRLHSLVLIGDAEAPNTIAQAVFSGHLAAREFDELPVEGAPFKIERTQV